MVPLLGFLRLRRLLRLDSQQQATTPLDAFLHRSRLIILSLPADLLPLRSFDTMHWPYPLGSIQDTVGLDQLLHW